MTKPQQVNAWANYDNTAKNARRLQSDGEAPQLRRRRSGTLGNSTHSRQSRGSALGDSRGNHSRASGHFSLDSHKGGVRTLSSSHHTADLLVGNVSRHGKSPIFLEFVTEHMFDGFAGDGAEQVISKEMSLNSSEQVLVGEMATTEEEVLPTITLNIKDIYKITEVLPIFFDPESLEKKQAGKSCSIRSFLSSMNATMPWVQDYLKSEFLLFIEMCLRGIGQVYFQNSPLSGLLVLIALFLQSPTVAVHGVIGLIFGNLVALGLGFDKGLARSGLFGYNSLLVGLAIATFDVNSEYHVAKIIMVVLFASFSSVVFVMLGKMLVPYKSPPLTLPFVFSTLLFLLSTANMERIDYGSVRTPSLPDYSVDPQNNLSTVSWIDFLEGTVRGVGQVYFADNLASGILIIAAIAVCSRISAVAAFLGSALGAAIAIASGVPSTAVTQGMYGFNPSLSATAMLMFYNPSVGASILAIFAGVMSVPAQQALASMLQPYGLPFMTLPFCVISLSFIIIQGTTSMVLAVPLADMTVPEDHLDRINQLEDGLNLLKESIMNDKAPKIHSRKLRKSFKMIESAQIGKEEQSVDELHTSRSSFSLEGLLTNNSEEDVKDKARELFYSLVGRTDRDYLTIQEILSCLRKAGVVEGEPILLASLILNLTDRDGSKMIDEVEFVCFCMVANAAKIIRMKLFKFFDFVDPEANGSIDFYAIDAALEYLGRPCLTTDEKSILFELSSSMNSEDDAIETVELIDIVTLEKIRLLLHSSE